MEKQNGNGQFNGNFKLCCGRKKNGYHNFSCINLQNIMRAFKITQQVKRKHKKKQNYYKLSVPQR